MHPNSKKTFCALLVFIGFLPIPVKPIFSGFVALVVGDDNTASVEVYSPNGKCNYRLAPLPSARRHNPVLVYANHQIIACSGGVACWEYRPQEDSWTTISTAPFTHNYQPGVVLQDNVVTGSKANFFNN